MVHSYECEGGVLTRYMSWCYDTRRSLFILPSSKKRKREMTTYLPDEFEISGCVSVELNYERSYQQMIDAAMLNWCNPGISQASFPVRGAGKLVVHPFVTHCMRGTRIDFAADALAKLHLQPAPIEYYFGYAEKFPNEQQSFPMVCACLPWEQVNGALVVPCFTGTIGQKIVDLYWHKADLPQYWRILAVRDHLH